MVFLVDNALDNGLSYLTSVGNRLDICNAEPTTYTEATSTFTVGNKASLTVGSPTNGDSSGRKVVIPSISDGSVTASSTASHWALVSSTGSELLAAQSLSATQPVTSGNTFTLPAIDITIPDP